MRLYSIGYAYYIHVEIVKCRKQRRLWDDGFLHTLINNLSSGVHSMSGCRFCGPRTKLKKRFYHGNKDNNLLDIAYR